MRAGRGLAYVAVLAAFVTACAALADFDAQNWRHYARMRITRPPPVADGLIEALLSEEVLDLAQPTLADLRVVDNKGGEVPYVTRKLTARQGVGVKWREGRLYNRTYLPDVSSSVVVDLGERDPHDRLRVKTAGADFRREMQVEASDDGAEWRVARERALLFRVTGERGIEFEKNEAPIPLNDQRYVRITVFNGKGDPRQVEIESVAAAHIESVKGPDPAVPVSIRSRTVSQERHATLIEMDMGFRNLSIERIELSFAEANFFRRGIIEGRQTETLITQKVLEDGSIIAETEAAPWVQIGDFVIYRYASGGPEEASLRMRPDCPSCRYVRLRIENADDAPLTLREVRVWRSPMMIRFVARPGGARLFVGNPDATPPTYDLANYAARLEKEGMGAATLESVVDIARRTPLVKPWTERYPWILWAVLAGTGFVLALIIARQVRTVKQTDTKQPPTEP
jgi:hypothetical protein